jgi:hypothetical protein
MNFRVSRWLAAGLLALLAGSPLHAAWNNVFQVCCNSCGGQTSASYYAPPADPCNPCPPPPCCTTRYIQRSYYQPVVTYQTKTYYEPVTTYRTSYFWEPVQTVRYTSFYDPSTCCFRQQACPVTAYRLRSQCCPVQSVVARCCTVPVTTQQLMTYYEPQTTCTSTTIGAPVAAPPPGTMATPPLGPMAAPPPGAGVNDSQTGVPPAGVRDSGDNFRGSDSYKPETMPPASGSSLRQLTPQSPGNVKTPSNESQPPPRVRLDKIVSLPKN